MKAEGVEAYVIIQLLPLKKRDTVSSIFWLGAYQLPWDVCTSLVDLKKKKTHQKSVRKELHLKDH